MGRLRAWLYRLAFALGATTKLSGYSRILLPVSHSKASQPFFVSR
jgi:hypothetical protein